jgi:hypothetical protein
MNDFNSQELISAKVVQSSITDNSLVTIDRDQIKNDLKLLILLKDKNLISLYDKVSIYRENSQSGIENIKNFLNILKDYYIDKYRQDPNKNLTIRKSFDILSLALETLYINGIDVSSNEVNTILLSFLNKNFI